MTDYISREAAIMTLRETADCANCNASSSVVCDFCDIENAARLINGIPSADVEPVRRWIPCSERLPEAGKRVLATDGGFVGEMYINRRGQWQRHNVVNHESLMALDILFWMPLPEPPEEGGGGNAAD